MSPTPPLDQIPKRAEEGQGPQQPDTFVELAATDILDTDVQRVIYGRRGTGKAHAMIYVRAVAESGELAQEDATVKPAIRVLRGNFLEHKCDILVVKYAQEHYGVDEAVAFALLSKGPTETAMSPQPGGFRVLESRGAVSADS